MNSLDWYLFLDFDLSQNQGSIELSRSERNLLTFPCFFTLFCADVFSSFQILQLSAHAREKMIWP